MCCRLRRIGVFLLTAVLVISAVSATPTGATGHHAPAPGAAQLGDAGIDPDGVLLRADLRANGDARWTVEYRVRLNDENTTAAFESLRDDIEANESAYTSTFTDRMRATVQAAENTTGREMQVQNVSVSASRQQLPQEYGVVTYQFDWVGFAVAGDNTLEAGDALEGLFLDRQTTFVVGWSDEYATTNVQPSPDDRRDNAVVWVGPTDFGAGEPVVSLSTTASETAANGGGGSGNGGDGEANGANGGGSPLVPLIGGVLLVVIGVGAVLWWRRSQRSSVEATADAGGAASSGAEPAGERGDTAETTSADATDRDATASEDESTADDTSAVEDDGEDTGADEADVAPWEDELLSNEERVLALLEHNDGRMKQQAIAAELDWSDAKTSQVIGKLRDAEEIETFRLGRENVVSLPGSGLS